MLNGAYHKVLHI